MQIGCQHTQNNSKTTHAKQIKTTMTKAESYVKLTVLPEAIRGLRNSGSETIEYFEKLFIKYGANTNHPRYQKLMEYGRFVGLKNEEIILQCATIHILLPNLMQQFQKLFVLFVCLFVRQFVVHIYRLQHKIKTKKKYKNY